MAGRDLDADFLIGSSNKARAGSGFSQHWKYPQTVGNGVEGGRDSSGFNFNSHESSEFAKKRMDNLSTMINEPFMLFEFMQINESNANEKAHNEQIALSKILGRQAENTQDNSRSGSLKKGPSGQNASTISGGDPMTDGANFLWNQSISNWLSKYTTAAEREYTGSVALYMPTDIQINDSMVYNEDTRKLGAALNSLVKDETELLNLTVLTDPAVLAAVGAGLGAIPFVPFGAALGGVLTGAIGTVAQTEVQRHTGRIMNPNELVKYSQTALRTFTFNWTILPDNEHESDQAAGLIKFFRKSAHARKTSSTMVTVPDHVVTSFHGAKDMIQLPPCFIESVNVTYNPNNSSFFKRNNAPVEIGLSISLKEIVPIYQDDVERGL
tara:strand:- start:245 stop:1390 length:1146 start_codon:yes stop_codon:yes gene_type:complete